VALELPGWLVTAFYLIGLPWPGIDEDELRGWAGSLRSFADGITASSAGSHQAIAGLADSSESSYLNRIAARSEHNNQLIADLHGPMNDFADALDVAADVVVAQKWAVIAAATTLAGEFIATQVGAFFTFGLDEAALPEEIISTRELVKFALEYLEAELIGKLIGVSAQVISDHVSHFLASFLTGDAMPVAMEVLSLKLTYDTIRDTAQEVRGHATETDEIGTTAYSENTDRDIEDASEGGDADGDGGQWAAVVQAVKQCLFDIAASLFRDLPRVLSDDQNASADGLLTFANRIADVDRSMGDDVPHEPSTTSQFRDLTGTAKDADWVSGDKDSARGVRYKFMKHHEDVGVDTLRDYDLSARRTIQDGKSFTYRDRATNEPRVGYWNAKTDLFTATSVTRRGTTIFTHYDQTLEQIQDLPGFSWR
jgi:hypothetical protein